MLGVSLILLSTFASLSYISFVFEVTISTLAATEKSFTTTPGTASSSADLSFVRAPRNNPTTGLSSLVTPNPSFFSITTTGRTPTSNQFPLILKPKKYNHHSLPSPCRRRGARVPRTVLLRTINTIVVRTLQALYNSSPIITGINSRCGECPEARVFEPSAASRAHCRGGAGHLAIHTRRITQLSTFLQPRHPPRGIWHTPRTSSFDF